MLEPASQAFVDATSTPPFLYELTRAEARKVLDDVQAAPIDKLPVEDQLGHRPGGGHSTHVARHVSIVA